MTRRIVEGDRVRHEGLGRNGKAWKVIGEWVLVIWDGYLAAIRYHESKLEKIEEEGEHGQEQSSLSAE